VVASGQSGSQEGKGRVVIESHPFGFEVTADHPCDRCNHPLRRHGPPFPGSFCELRYCLCDGYVVRLDA
jgi:hypothetical protein